MTDERIKLQYINDHRLHVVTHIISAMIMGPEDHGICSPFHNDRIALDMAFELASELLDIESDLQLNYSHWLRDRQKKDPSSP